MKQSEQDRFYLEREGDRFFERNRSTMSRDGLRPKKQSILDNIHEAGIKPRSVLEYGCNYGDLLHVLREQGATRAVGVEASLKAVEHGRERYAPGVQLEHGTLADNAVNRDPQASGSFDLVVVDDVLCWVSRQTLFQSIANIDDAIAEQGYLFLREFLPLSSRRNPNHHAEGVEIYCHKPAGPHAAMFLASGMYATVWQKVWMDKEDAWANARPERAFESRWIDSILLKSHSQFYETP